MFLIIGLKWNCHVLDSLYTGAAITEEYDTGSAKTRLGLKLQVNTKDCYYLYNINSLGLKENVAILNLLLQYLHLTIETCEND